MAGTRRAFLSPLPACGERVRERGPAQPERPLDRRQQGVTLVSLFLSVQCDCGAPLADHLAPELESTLPLPVAPDATGAPRSVDAAAFIAWHAHADATLTDLTRPVPTVYRVWLH